MLIRPSAILSIALLAGASLPADAARAPESTAHWREDIEALRRELPKVHKNAFHTTSREQLDAAAEALSARVPDLADHEIVVGIAEIVASVGDGHTFINPSAPAAGFHMLPLRLYDFSDGLFVTAASESYANLVGGKVVRIGSQTASEAMTRVLRVTPRDNAMTGRAMAPAYLAIPEVLHALGVTDSVERVKLSIEKDGTVREVHVEPVQFREIPSLEMIRADGGSALPLYLRGRPVWPMAPLEKNFWFEVLPESETIYVKFEAVQWQDDISPARFFRDVFAAADANPDFKLVIDVRNNGGGNNTLALPVIHEIIKRDHVNQRGKLFTIIGRETFSAAQNFVNMMEKHTNVMFAGEPTGARPNHYGDPRPIRLPNSGLEIRASSLWWQDVHPADDRESTLPHLFVELSSSDLMSGRDPVLDAVIAFDDDSLLRTKMLTGISAGGAEGAIAAYRAYKSDPVNQYQSLSQELNALGYSLLEEEKLDDAITVFRLNTSEHPDSANLWDSLGEGYSRKGDIGAAVAAFEKAVELAPQVPYFRRRLEEARNPSP